MPSPAVQKATSLAIAKDSTENLTVSFNGKTIERGQQVPRAEAQQTPQLSFSGAGPYIAISIDLDAPFSSFPILGPILHWVQPDLRAESGGGVLSAGNVPVITEWVAPKPPPGAGPHRYLFLIYDQPADFDRKTIPVAEGLSARIRFDLAKLEHEAKLGPIVAATYFNSN